MINLELPFTGLTKERVNCTFRLRDTLTGTTNASPAVDITLTRNISGTTFDTTDTVLTLMANSASNNNPPRIGINQTNPNASSILDVTSTTQGVLLPRMTTTQKNAISSPADSLLVYDTTLESLQMRSSTRSQYEGFIRKVYDSGQLTITLTSAGNQIVNHNLGFTPDIVRVYAECISTDGDSSSFGVGRRFEWHNCNEDGNKTKGVSWNSSNVIISTNNSGGFGGTGAIRPDNGAWTSLTNSKWRFIVMCFHI